MGSGVADAGDILSVVFGAVFIASGALKLRDPRWPDAARALGTPDPVVPLVAPGELVLGVWIVVGLAAPVSIALGCALLVVFTGLLLRVVGSDAPPVCACFGGLTARPVGWGSIVRNAVLLLVGLAALGLVV